MLDAGVITAFDSDEWLQERLSFLSVRAKMNADGLARIAGLSRAGYYKKRANPETFTLAELRRLERLAKRHHMSVLYKDGDGTP